MMRRTMVQLLKTLRKTYEWRAQRYKDDADGWKRQGQERLHAFYSGRAEECRAMMKEIDELIVTIRVF